MDDLDFAADLEEAQRQSGIARNQVEVPPRWWDGKTCIEPDCDEEVEPGRRALRKPRCLACQLRKEKR